jgi:hypothetical protein
MKIKSIKGLEIELRIEGLKSNYKIIGKFRVEGKDIETELDLQDWRTSTRNRTQYPGLYYRAKEAYIQIKPEDYEAIKKAINELPEGQKIIRLVKTATDLDGYNIEDIRVVKENIGGVIDKNGSWVNEDAIKAVMIAEGISEVTLERFLEIYNTKYADKEKEYWNKVKEELRRQYYNDAIETGKEQALKNVFGTMDEKEEKGDQ